MKVTTINHQKLKSLLRYLDDLPGPARQELEPFVSEALTPEIRLRPGGVNG